MLANGIQIVEVLAAFDLMQLFGAVNALEEKVWPMAAHVAGFSDVLDRDPVIFGPLGDGFIALRRFRKNNYASLVRKTGAI